jgi:hypothetical protein
MSEIYGSESVYIYIYASNILYGCFRQDFCRISSRSEKYQTQVARTLKQSSRSITVNAHLAYLLSLDAHRFGTLFLIWLCAEAFRIFLMGGPATSVASLLL